MKSSVTRFLFASLILTAAAIFIAACSTPPATATPAPAPTAAPPAPSGSGSAAAVPPAQRADMYKSVPAMTIDVNKKYRAVVQTNKGDILIDLFPQDAPQTVNNFVFLARDGFYDGLTFHRVEKDPEPFVIQGGDPEGTGRGGPGYTVPAEIKRTHPRGAIAMARLPDQVNPERESSGSQFYIALSDVPFLDGAYTSFGQTTEDSMAVADQIAVGDVINHIIIEEQ
jgi:cyclophilin family peptidyl-prolyl cis-trans isomerase